jgi:LysM repeat protein
MIKLLTLIGFSFFTPDAAKDSIGTEIINGRTFVIHKVDEKETLFAISRRYNTTVDAIIQYNSAAGNALEVGQILKVPYFPKVSTVDIRDGSIHKVAAKETLYSISRMYGVSTEDLKIWNGLTDNALSIGQELIIKKKNDQGSTLYQPVTRANPVISKNGIHTVVEKETMFSITRQYNITIDQLREWNNLESNELKVGQALFVVQPERGMSIAKQESPPVSNTTTPPVSKNTTTPTQQTSSLPPVVQDDKKEKKEPTPTVKTEVKEQPIRISESVRNSDEVIQTGIAELIEGTEGNRKYIALHRTAPIGTILKIRNEMNNLEIFAKVIGKLPDTAMTDKLIIKLSKSAYDKLGAIDPRFRVEVTYYK